MLGSGQKRFIRSFGGSILGLTVVLGACGGDDDTAGNDDETTESTDDQSTDTNEARGLGTPGSSGSSLAAGSSWAATARPDVTEVNVYPDATSTTPSHTLSNPDDHGATLSFLVDGADVSGSRTPVYLPVPPNGSTGWIDTSAVELVENPYAITVELGAHRLTVTRGEETVVDTDVAVGKDGTETPTGLYFITDLQEPPDPNGDYGPYFFTISGFPTDPALLDQFGEDTVIGIHGTNKPELLGTDVSSGCVRVNSDIITELTGYIPLGTPVTIVS